MKPQGLPRATVAVVTEKQIKDATPAECCRLMRYLKESDMEVQA